MCLKFTFIFSLVAIFGQIKSAKILIIAPGISSSHLQMMGKLADYLVADEHDVVSKRLGLGFAYREARLG
jgi:hypothetical protein